MSTHIDEIVLHRIDIPLTRPYSVSQHTFHTYVVTVIEARSRDGAVGWGEAVLRAGYNRESPDTVWAFARDRAPRLAGLDTAEAKALLAESLLEEPQATSALTTALEMLEGAPILDVTEAVTVPILAPVLTMQPSPELDAEVEELLAAGFRTLKVKVGFDVERDLARLGAIARRAGSRAALRLDANAGFSRAQGLAFAQRLEPGGIEFFEQPCAKDDWDANAAVAAVSPVPVMLDEPIWNVAAVERAATIPGVRGIKVKLKKLGGIARCAAALERARALGLSRVLGDGVATDIGNWQEACIARATIDCAGDNNGFLKLQAQLFEDPLPFGDGAIHLSPAFRPRVDRAKLDRFLLARERHTAVSQIAT